MHVNFGMDTEQILANATTLFWMRSFISGHKQLNIYSETGFPSHTLKYPESQSYCNSLMIDSWSTASDAR